MAFGQPCGYVLYGTRILLNVITRFTRTHFDFIIGSTVDDNAAINPVNPAHGEKRSFSCFGRKPNRSASWLANWSRFVALSPFTFRVLLGPFRHIICSEGLKTAFYFVYPPFIDYRYAGPLQREPRIVRD